MYIEVAWIGKADRLAYVGAGIEGLIGWTAEETQRLPLESLVTPFTLEHVKQNYFRGPSTSIVPRAFPVWLCHKEGHEICARFSAVCRYDESGDLAEAWGCVRHCQRQCTLNDLLAWWPGADERDLGAVAHMVEMYAAV